MLIIMFDGALHLTAEGWRKLTWSWAFFFLFLAALNEPVWRTQTTEHWVTFKSFGFLPLTILFAVAQAPAMTRYEAKGAGRRFSGLHGSAPQQARRQTKRPIRAYQ